MSHINFKICPGGDQKMTTVFDTIAIVCERKNVYLNKAKLVSVHSALHS